MLPLSAPVPSLEAETLQQLAAMLARLGYPAAQELDLPKGPLPLDGSEPRLALLRRLFWRGETLPASEVEAALQPLSAAGLLESGLLQRVAEGIRALFQIQVYTGLFFIADFLRGEQPPDLVLPIGPSGKYLADATIRRPVATALDLGCGTGVQTLLMSRHAGQVTATDINPRALAITRLNAAMNGINNVETLQGSYFEPVAGRTFDLLVGNLPYVITPENKYIYRDVGAIDDLPIRENVEKMPAHLNEGGFGQLMINWIHRADQAWYEPIDSWTRRRNADSWLIYSKSDTPEQYIGQWLLMDDKADPEGYARRRDQWLRWYAAHQIERIAFGLLTLRRRTTQDNWRCSLEVKFTTNVRFGEHVQHLFACQDYLAGLRTPGDLLDRRLRPHLMKVGRQPDGKYFARTTQALVIEASIDEATAKAISWLDGRRDLRACIRRALGPRLLGRNAAADLIAREVYRLIDLGLIAPAA